MERVDNIEGLDGKNPKRRESWSVPSSQLHPPKDVPEHTDSIERINALMNPLLRLTRSNDPGIRGATSSSSSTAGAPSSSCTCEMRPLSRVLDLGFVESIRNRIRGDVLIIDFPRPVPSARPSGTGSSGDGGDRCCVCYLWMLDSNVARHDGDHAPAPAPIVRAVCLLALFVAVRAIQFPRIAMVMCRADRAAARRPKFLCRSQQS